MARWQLSTSHYLSVENNEWEYNETDRGTGKQLRTRIKVPLYLDINDQNCWNVQYRNPRGEVISGEVIVARRTGEEHKDDIIFVGDPTPDMIPLDDEAKAISETFSKRWGTAPNVDMSYGQHVIEGFQAEQARIQSEANIVKIEGMAEIMKTMSDMLAQNQQLIMALAATKIPERRV
jgi:hypothetical protein